MNSGTEQEQPGQCKREKYAGGGSPSPRLCDVCLEGPCQRMQGTQQAEEISWMQIPADREMVIKPTSDVA
jgi:hypothetical protein